MFFCFSPFSCSLLSPVSMETEEWDVMMEDIYDDRYTSSSYGQV